MFYTEKYRKMRGRMPSENTEKAVSLFLHLFSHHRAHSYVYSLPVRGCTWQLSPSLRRSDRAIRCWYLFTAKRYAHLCQRGLCHDVRDHPRPTHGQTFSTYCPQAAAPIADCPIPSSSARCGSQEHLYCACPPQGRGKDPLYRNSRAAD